MIGSDPGEPLRRRVLREVLVLCGIGIVVAGGTLVIREFLAMQEEVERLSVLAYEPHPDAYVPEVPAVTLEGDSVVLGKLGQRQLLFFLNTSCGHCRASIPAWNHIAQTLETDTSVVVLGIVFGDTAMAEAYRLAQGVQFPLVPTSGPRLAGLFRINAVPAVVLTTRQGRITFVRVGRMDGSASMDSVLSASLENPALSQIAR